MLTNPARESQDYQYLNYGYRLPLVGGTDKMSGDVPVGLYRTYARLPPTSSTTTPGAPPCGLAAPSFPADRC